MSPAPAACRPDTARAARYRKAGQGMSVDHNLALGAESARAHPVATWVRRPANGAELAWAALGERYAPLIWSLGRRYQLGSADAADVGQSVWLQLVSQLGTIRDPAALPGWLATT